MLKYNWLVGWTGSVLIVAISFTFLYGVVNRYNELETKRALACTAEHGVYLHNSCSWSK